MDADCAFSIQLDHLEPDVNQGTTYPRFLEEQDAMDAMLWGDVPIPPINPWPDSQDITGFGANSYTNLRCVCDFPSLYCEQHGVYGDQSLDHDLSLPSFGPGQITTNPDDVLESSGPAPGRLELTEEIPTGHSLFQSPFEMDHANLSMPANDQSDLVYIANDSPVPVNPLVKRRLRRSKISSKNKRILMGHFSRQRYPGTRELDELRERTGLEKKCINTWFGNTRHRTAYGRSPVAQLPQESQERSVSETPSQASTSLTAESLRELNRLSPANDKTPLERLFASLYTKEDIPSTAVESLTETCLNIGRDADAENNEHRLAEWRRQCDEILQRTKGKAKVTRSRWRRTGGAGSVAGSDSSMDSGGSAGSWRSQNSADSRGSRKGRRNWVQTPDQLNATASLSNTEEGKTSATNKLAKSRPWYCTWPSCPKSFQYRSECDRHEMAVHYWPYHWVCNKGEPPSMIHKDAASLSFFREDQFTAHIRRRHPEIIVTKYLISTSRQDNPNFDPESLRCGFCGQVLRNWKARQSHVAVHIQKGLPKSAWLCEQISV